MIISIVLSGCSGGASQISPEPPVTSPPETELTPAQTVDNDAPGEPATASQVVLNYWEALNSYDLERALSYYEEQYREREEEEVKDDISKLRQFSVTLSVTNVSEPVFIDQDKARCEIILNTPIGDRNLIYLLERIDGDWKIYFENYPEEFVEAEEFIIEFLGSYGESQRMDIIINAEQQQEVERGATEFMLSELTKSGGIVEVRPGVFSLPSQQ
jgi:hypothetical protein